LILDFPFLPNQVLSATSEPLTQPPLPEKLGASIRGTRAWRWCQRIHAFLHIIVGFFEAILFSFTKNRGRALLQRVKPVRLFFGPNQPFADFAVRAESRTLLQSISSDGLNIVS
jgi:hypothetical protein